MADEITTASQPELTPVEKAEKVLKELNEKIISAEGKIKSFQEIEARRILGGQTNAGAQPEQPKEESAKDYAKRVSLGKV